jgi:arylsulfatase A-like enzyme
VLEPGSATLPALMKQGGFATAVVGKWHLGLGASPTQYNGVVSPGPLDVGFDYAWVMPSTGDRVPCVFVENRSVANLDPADPFYLDQRVQKGKPRSFLIGIPRIGEQKGGAAALWTDDTVADVIVSKAVAWLEAQTRARQRFFLSFAPQDAHEPRCPARFAGKSQAGVRGDVVQRFDDTVGQLLDALERLGVADNTLVIVTSDNGGIAVSKDDQGADVKHTGTHETNNGHPINGPMRGFKGDVLEGGNRVPFIVRWPARVTTPGSTSDALVGQVDMLATMARLTGQALPDAAGLDSSGVLGALLDSRTAGRAEMVLHALRAVALRQGLWKLIAGPNDAQLSDLATDIGEAHDLAKRMPALAKDMRARLAKVEHDGRSRA